ncbi:hypothetical protein CSZ94_01900 [Janthinobacterium sp. ROICE36]|nr:hypothetical protein CSZ94_01900 [Janthinobacterium sp. ROICE36]
MHRFFLSMQGIAPFHIQAGQIEHRLPVQPLCRLTRQINDFFVIAVFHENFRVFHGARFEEPVLRLRIDGRYFARLGFANEIRNMGIEKWQALVAWQDFFRVVWHFAGKQAAQEDKRRQASLRCTVNSGHSCFKPPVSVC